MHNVSHSGQATQHGRSLLGTGRYSLLLLLLLYYMLFPVAEPQLKYATESLTQDVGTAMGLLMKSLLSKTDSYTL